MMLSRLLLLFSFITIAAQAQISAPIAEDVFGGQIGDIAVWQFDSDSVYVAITTDSPNSIFYASAARGATRQNLPWQALPSADVDDGFGASVTNVEGHRGSDQIYFLAQSKLYRSSLTATTATAVDSMVKNFTIVNDTLIMIKNGAMPGSNDELHFGQIDASGNYTAGGQLSLLHTYSGIPQLLIHPQNKQVYLFEAGASPYLGTITDPYFSLSASSSVASVVNPAPSVSNIDWRTYGFATNGTAYVAGQPPLNNPTARDRHIAWKEAGSLSWSDTAMNTPGPIGGVVGNNFVIDDAGTGRHIFIGNAVLSDTSNMAQWQNPGSIFLENLNRVNDGYTRQDPISADLKYHSTNVGMGYSTSNGDSVFAWNDGLTALQINDLDMSADFSVGWVASKSGMRNVTGYKSGSPRWSGPIFPNFDGSPYTAVAMDPSDDSLVFAGNQRIYKLDQNLGNNWTRVFDPETSPYFFNRINSRCQSICVSALNPQVIMAGYSIEFADKGGVFYSLDGGSTWQQLLLNASTAGQDLDVLDVAFTEESGRVVAYIGVEADPTTSGAYGLFRAELNGSTWTVTRDGAYGATDAIVDIEVSGGGDSLVILNYDPGLLPVNQIQIKELSTGTFTNVIGPNVGGRGSAVTLGGGFAFVAIGEEIYASPFASFSSWFLAYAYPVGTQINTLFYDELLVGTETGLYAHALDNDFNLPERPEKLLSAYPQPADWFIQLSATRTYRAYDLQGRLRYESKRATEQIDCRHWPEGIYLLDFNAGESLRVLIQH